MTGSGDGMVLWLLYELRRWLWLEQVAGTMGPLPSTFIQLTEVDFCLTISSSDHIGRWFRTR